MKKKNEPMSLSHHSSPEEEEATRRFVDQILGKAQEHFAEGRLNKQDQGDLSFAIASDKKNGVVLMHFGKPVVWAGLTKQEALRMADLLITHAAEL